ncbi:MAG: hypothetical protein JW981_02920 [Anaerolineae bacterium]|nr:hypothetical protein [Anaerolineae bacterium]
MNAKTRTLVVGGVIGAIFGVLAAWMYVNSSPIEVDREGIEHVPMPSAGNALKMGLGLLTLLRQIAD